MDREAMQMALEALESDPISHAGLVNRKQAITALRQALETEQEPVAWISEGGDVSRSKRYMDEMGFKCNPLYTAPPKRDLTCVCGAVWEGETMVHPPRKREWVGLTDKEHDSIKHNYHNMTWTLEMFARAIEQALKEKNHG